MGKISNALSKHGEKDDCKRANMDVDDPMLCKRCSLPVRPRGHTQLHGENN